jgi:dihydroneopterin triphosphate diphosphatase
MRKVFKIPQSVLVVIHTPALEVLLIKRADYSQDEGEFWQSVTGSKDSVDEPFVQAAKREVLEETGIDCSVGRALGYQLRDWRLENVYDIYPRWSFRYAPDVSRNTEHLFGLQVPAATRVQLNPREHNAYRWLPWREAAELCYSPSNSEAILMLPKFIP